ncbi:MAG TPA: hydantoinase B/oxoprolinase family protein, partial [Solirubrobacterales bacterium]|nr:hydantoinase B/oxoprolinase family protein [Solirubrobacterales bacterium]
GLQINAIKVVEEGRRNAAAWQLLRDNIRAAELVIGDMEAQMAACQLGAQRFTELIERYGLDLVRAASEDLMDYSERMLRRQIEALPDGIYRATGHLDGFEELEDPAYRDLVIEVAVTVSGSDIEVDFSGTSPQIDRPINMPFEGTVDIAVYLTLRSILLDSDREPSVPTNSGLFRPISISAPRGSLANPIHPAPVIARFCSGNIVADTVMHALAAVAPERVSAGVGNLKVVAYSGLDERGEHWVLMDIIEGSYGGREGKDGLDAVDTLYANTRNNPIEDVESHYPLRVVRYELDDAARGGAGRWRGGRGSVREVEFLAPGGFSIEADGHRWAPWGFAGGADGSPGRIVVTNAGASRELPSKVPYHRAEAGDTLRMVGPAGGGFGLPAERAEEARAADLADGFKIGT